MREANPPVETAVQAGSTAYDIEGLYLGDAFVMSAGGQVGAESDACWDRVAERHTEDAEAIRRLHNALRAAREVQGGHDESTIALVSIGFRDVEDPVARQMLTELLVARLCTSRGNIGGGAAHALGESKRMLTELKDGTEARAVTPTEIISRALDGRLYVPDHGLFYA